MHEIVLILFFIIIATMPLGYFTKHDIPDVIEVKPQVVKQKRTPVGINTDIELDMKMFNGLQEDIQAIILKYV